MFEIRCSGLSRPMICAGSLFFKNLPEQETNPAAEEGTAAGECLRFILENKPVPERASNNIHIDDDMIFFTTPIADEIKSNVDGQILCEKRIDWKTRSGIWIRGQYDMSFVRNGDLYIDDLKYGWGIVEPKENWQLLGYAIGEIIRRGEAFNKIVMRIRQPRPHHEDGDTREWVLTYPELLQYKEKIESRMDEIAAGENKLVTSPKCKYCPAAGSCPSFSKMFYRGIEVIQDFIQDDISEQEISFQLDLIARVSDVLKIKSDSLNTLAVDKIKNGKIIPNYINEPRYGDRKWKAEISPDVIKTLTGKDVIEQTMMSPAKAEKIGISKDFVNQLVDRHFLGQKLKRCDTNELGNKIFGKTK